MVVAGVTASCVGTDVKFLNGKPIQRLGSLTGDTSTAGGGSSLGTALAITFPYTGAALSTMSRGGGTHSDYTDFNISGTCLTGGGNVTLTWTVSGVVQGTVSVACAASAFSTNIDFSALSDATVTTAPIVMTATQSGQTDSSIDLYKYTTLCAANAATTLTSMTMGSGTSTDPFIICDVPQLRDVTNVISAVAANTTYFKIVNNLHSIGATETPIVRAGQTLVDSIINWDGSTTEYKMAVFDASLSGSNHAGFFTELAGVGNVIKNWTLTDMTITNDTAAGSEGILVGKLSGTTTLTRVSVINPTITESAAENAAGNLGTEGKGGVVGVVANSVDTTYSYVTSVGGSVTSSVTVRGAGGIVGYVGNGIVSTATTTISHSYSTTAVTGFSAAGGLIGSTYGTAVISDSYATGSVNSSYTQGGLVGAVVSGSITRSYSTGTVSGGLYTGGLVGVAGLNDDGVTSNTVTISESYTTSTLNSSAGIVGGLIGCVGLYMFGTTPGNIVISDSYAKNTVTVADGGNASSVGFGALIGAVVTEGTISLTNVYAHNDISFTLNAGSQVSHGGLIGVWQYTGAFLGTHPLASYLTGQTFSGAYWVKDGGYNTTVSFDLKTVDADTDTADVDLTGVDTLTDAQMQVQGNFTGFDFTATTGKWKIDTGISNYPVLMWQ